MLIVKNVINILKINNIIEDSTNPYPCILNHLWKQLNVLLFRSILIIDIIESLKYRYKWSPSPQSPPSHLFRGITYLEVSVSFLFKYLYFYTHLFN